DRRQCHRDRADQHQAHAGILDDRQHGLHADGLSRRQHQLLQRGDVLYDHLCDDHAGQLRHGIAALARRLRSRPAGRLQGPQSAQSVVCVPDAADDVLAGRHSAHRRLLRQVRRDRGRRRRWARLARRRGGDGVADRSLLLPAHRQADVFRRSGRYRAAGGAKRYQGLAVDQRTCTPVAGHFSAMAAGDVRGRPDAVLLITSRRADKAESNSGSKMRVGFFVTCLVDLMRPATGLAAIRLLEAGGARVFVPPAQTCCGQPGYNSGDRAGAIALARKLVAEFESCDYLVAAPGSCTVMIKTHYADLFRDDPPLLARAAALSAKTFELSDFLANVLDLDAVPGTYTGTVTYHDSCAGLREMGVKQQPRALLARMPGVRLVEMTECETCCGFGGTFSIKYGEIATGLPRQQTQ